MIIKIGNKIIDLIGFRSVEQNGCNIKIKFENGMVETVQCIDDDLAKMTVEEIYEMLCKEAIIGEIIVDEDEVNSISKYAISIEE